MNVRTLELVITASFSRVGVCSASQPEVLASRSLTCAHSHPVESFDVREEDLEIFLVCFVIRVEATDIAMVCPSPENCFLISCQSEDRRIIWHYLDKC